MSIWYSIEDPEDVDLSKDGKTLDVLFKSDDSGNHYVEIPIEFVERCLHGRTVTNIEKAIKKTDALIEEAEANELKSSIQ
jgi:hypothetical protein